MADVASSGGYTQGWDWTGVSDKDTLWHWMQPDVADRICRSSRTGFTGNSVLGWVQFLILPILFPTVVVPAAEAWLTAKREGAEADQG